MARPRMRTTTPRFASEAPETTLGRQTLGAYLFVLVKTQGESGQKRFRSLLDEASGRLDDLGGAFEDAMDVIDDPTMYRRPDRLLGEPAPDSAIIVKGRRTWGDNPELSRDDKIGGGYLVHHRVRITDQGVRIFSSRPFHPTFNQRGNREWTRRIWDWIRAAETPETARPLISRGGARGG